MRKASQTDSSSNKKRDAEASITSFPVSKKPKSLFARSDSVSSVRSAESDCRYSEPAKNEEVDLHCHEEMEPTIRVRVKSISNSSDLVQLNSPVEVTTSSSWLLTRLNGGHDDTGCQDAASRKNRDSSSPVPLSSFTCLTALLRSQTRKENAWTRQSSSSSAGGSVAVPACALNGSREVNADVYPCDWGLKTSAKFMSRKSFDWTIIDDSKRALFLHRYMTNASESSTTADPSEELLSALHYWRYPASPLPPVMEDIIKKQAHSSLPGTRDTEWFKGRVSEWTRAFESLFSSLRAGLTPYFYYIGDDFHILFHAAVPSAGGGGGGQPMRALMTHSSRGLRRRLEHHAIGFEMPYAAAVSESEEQASCRAEVQELLHKDKEMHVRETSRLGFTDGGGDSLLLFRGRNDVVGLFDFLKNLYRSDRDVAVLMSPRPFEDASLRTLGVRVKKISLAESLSRGDSEGFQLEVEGPVMPGSLTTLVTLLSKHQGVMEVKFGTDARTAGLNIDTTPKATVSKVRCMSDGTLSLSFTAQHAPRHAMDSVA